MSTKNLPSDLANAASSYIPKPSGGTTGQALTKQADGSIAYGLPTVPATGTFLDVSLGTGDGFTVSQTVSGGVFTTIIMTTVNADAASGYNTSSGIYTVPATGTYLILAKVRPVDATGNGTAASNFGIGVHTSNNDFPGFVWTTRGVPSTGAYRWTPDYQRLATFGVGAQVRMFVYSDSGSSSTSINSANLSIIRIA